MLGRKPTPGTRGYMPRSMGSRTQPGDLPGNILILRREAKS